VIAARIVMPEIAFEADIKGVCRIEGILEISSNPTNRERIKINTNVMVISEGIFA
jgi:hypothetical protein